MAGQSAVVPLHVWASRAASSAVLVLLAQKVEAVSRRDSSAHTVLCRPHALMYTDSLKRPASHDLHVRCVQYMLQTQMFQLAGLDLGAELLSIRKVTTVQ
jgi:hypothetical protein